MFCRKCGQKLIETSDFCHKCGTKTVSEDCTVNKIVQQKHEIRQVHHTVDMKYSWLQPNVENFVIALYQVLTTYANIKYVDLKLNIHQKIIRQAILTLDLAQNVQLPYQFEIKHFSTRGHVSFWKGLPEKFFDGQINAFISDNPRVKVRQTRNVSVNGVISEVYVVFSFLKS